MRVTTLTLLLLLAALPVMAQEQPADPLPGIPVEAAPADEAAIIRAFGITLGRPLPLSSKQVQAVSSPEPGLARYMLLFVPAPRLPYARYFAAVDVASRGVVSVTGRSRAQASERAAWNAFFKQINMLEKRYGPGMRLGGGSIWRLVRGGNAIDLQVDPASRTVQVVYAKQRGGPRFTPRTGGPQPSSPK